MNSRIYKYPLLPADVQAVNMPVGARVLAVQAQHDVPCIWALVDADAEFETWTIRVVGTGHDASDVADQPDHAVADYLGTFQLHGGSLVFHAFRVRP